MWVSSRCTSHRLTARGAGTEQPGRCRGKAGAAKALAPRCAGLRPQHRCLPVSDPVIARLTPARLPWEADDIRGAPGSRPPPGRQTGLFIRRKRSPVTLRLHVAFCFPASPARAGAAAPISGARQMEGAGPSASPGLGSPHVHPGPEPSRTWPTLAGLSEPPWDPRG